jgi:hypothetical protein
MGRPPLALGTAGTIRCYKPIPATAPASWSGTTTAPFAPWSGADHHGPAEPALKTALPDRAPVHASGEITADSRVSALAEAWYTGLVDPSPVTRPAYRDRLDRQILPGLGQLRVREPSIGVLDRHLRLVAEKHGVATARNCRSVLSGMCTLASRHDALTQNPVRAIGPVTGRPKKAPRALSLP